MEDGSTDLEITINDGDPSGLQFGPGTQLYSTVASLALPRTDDVPSNWKPLVLSVALPNVQTTGGENHIGFSFRPFNYNAPGRLGTMLTSGNGYVSGFGTHHISRFNGQGWSLVKFSSSFGGGSANMAVVIEGFGGGACVADVDDGSGTGTRDSGVGIEDLLYYLFVFESGTVAADVDDGSGTGVRDGGVGIEDLLYYLLRFEQGC